MMGKWDKFYQGGADSNDKTNAGAAEPKPELNVYDWADSSSEDFAGDSSESKLAYNTAEDIWQYYLEHRKDKNIREQMNQIISDANPDTSHTLLVSDILAIFNQHAKQDSEFNLSHLEVRDHFVDCFLAPLRQKLGLPKGQDTFNQMQILTKIGATHGHLKDYQSYLDKTYDDDNDIANEKKAAVDGLLTTLNKVSLKTPRPLQAFTKLFQSKKDTLSQHQEHKFPKALEWLLSKFATTGQELYGMFRKSRGEKVANRVDENLDNQDNGSIGHGYSGPSGDW